MLLRLTVKLSIKSTSFSPFPHNKTRLINSESQRQNHTLSHNHYNLLVFFFPSLIIGRVTTLPTSIRWCVGLVGQDFVILMTTLLYVEPPGLDLRNIVCETTTPFKVRKVTFCGY